MKINSLINLIFPQPLYTESECRHGTFRYFTADAPIGKSLTEFGEWAEDEIAFVQALLNEGDTVIDVGANIGTHSVAFAKTIGSSGKLYAIEPQPEVFKVLNWNLEKNGLFPRAQAINACVAHEIGEAAFPVLNYKKQTNFGAVQVLTDQNKGGNFQLVKQISLDSLNFSGCDFIKLDAEGFEIPVLQGASELIERFKPIFYVECNSIENGMALINYMKIKNYLIFYHQTRAFNPENFRNSSKNFFGFAHETSLLFVSSERLNNEKLKALIHPLPEIHCLDDFKAYFLNTLRYGDAPRNATVEKFKHVSQWLNLKLRPIVVIVPVYNALEDLKKLVQSLMRVIPQPTEGLCFIFSDDASPDLEVAKFFASHPFFQRCDVLTYRNNKNLGFVKNTNTSFAFAAKLSAQADFVILNSDTEIFPGLFSTLQDAAYSAPNIASVTPLTNNGSITSLFNWPRGSRIPEPFTVELISDVIAQLNFQSGNVELPTGVGFCMYFRREAFNRVGYFSKIFGKGYGEECDWCCRAIALGFKNILTLRAFVYHSGGQSFGQKRKNRRILLNNVLLVLRHANYRRNVRAHLIKDPLKFHRILIMLNLVKQTISVTNQIYLFTLHSDPDAVFTGGTEGHVRQLRGLLLNQNNAVLILAPIGQQRFVLRGMFGKNIFLEEFLQEGSLQNLMLLLEKYVDKLHVHHTIGWSDTAVKSLINNAIKIKTVTAHDFWFLCPSITLLTGQKQEWFCEVESDMKKCNSCLATKWKHPDETMQEYRAGTLKFLENFNTILMPSYSMLPYFKKAYGADWDQLAHKVKILPHDLSYLAKIKKIKTAPVKNLKNRFCFIGKLDGRKGSNLLIDAIPGLQQAGFEIEILGSIFPSYHPNLSNVKVKLYKTSEQLSQLLSENGGPDFLGYISIWAETFSYTFFEGLLLCPTAIPIVSPYGNPASVCKETGIGPVMSECMPAALIEAVNLAKVKREEYLKKITGYVEELNKKITQRSYITEYIKAITADVNHTKTKTLLSEEFLAKIAEQESVLNKRRVTLCNFILYQITKIRRVMGHLHRVGLVTAFRHLRGLVGGP